MIVWPSGWVRTLFFNPTQPDGQNPKPSPRVRTPELAQGSGSDRIASPAQPVGQIWPFNPRFVYEPKFGLSVRRTSMSIRFNPSNKNPNPINPSGQKPEPAQPFRTERVRPTLPNPRVGRPSSGSIQPDGHSSRWDSNQKNMRIIWSYVCRVVSNYELSVWIDEMKRCSAYKWPRNKSRTKSEYEIKYTDRT
jgi:hypothetical protein